MRGLKVAAALVVVPAMISCSGDVPTEGTLEPFGSGEFARLAGADHGGFLFEISLTGAEEAPGPGDPDGSGTARITLNQGQGQVCFEISVEDITLPSIGAHIHEAPAGEPGPIVVGLTAPDASGEASGCVSADRDLIKDIRQNPEDYYLNVHTTDFQPGAVRGQLG